MLGNAAAMATIPAEDLNRAKKFYTEVLGLKLAEEPSEGSALFEAGEGSQVFIYNTRLFILWSKTSKKRSTN
jgi:catechol 2,3-dioxygenase-like lactoylglutathione lyase family enzyme